MWGDLSPGRLWRLEETLTPPTLHSAGHQPQPDRSPDTGMSKGPLQRSVPWDRGKKCGVLLGALETACLQARPQPSGGQTPALCNSGSNRVQGSLGRGLAWGRAGAAGQPSTPPPPPRPPHLSSPSPQTVRTTPRPPASTCCPQPPRASGSWTRPSSPAWPRGRPRHSPASPGRWPGHGAGPATRPLLLGGERAAPQRGPGGGAHLAHERLLEPEQPPGPAQVPVGLGLQRHLHTERPRPAVAGDPDGSERTW